MKVLFIGGTGRLSKDVAALSAKNGDEVYLFTRGSAERDLFVKDKYHMVTGDIRDAKNSKATLAKYRFDVVIDFLSYNVKQLENTLYVVDGIYKQYIFVSSATVYNGQDGEIITEKDTPIGNDKWPYAKNKCDCERYVDNYFINRKEVYTIVRPYITYGNTRVPYPLVPRVSTYEWSLIDRIEKGLPVPTFLGGKTITTLTHTRDFAKGIVGVFANEKVYNDKIHITADKTVTWSEVLDVISESLDKDVKRVDCDISRIIHEVPVYKGVLLGDKAKNMRFDNSKIEGIVPDFRCEINLDEGIDDMITFYKEHPELQKIDFVWNGCMDRLCGENSYKYIKDVSIRQKMDYFVGRIYIFYIISLMIKKVKNWIG